MYKLCKTEESAARQRNIEKKLLSLMTTKSFDEITVSELCYELNMPRKAFYRYFDSKEDALHALIHHTMSEFESYTEGHTEDGKRSLQNDLEKFFKFWLEHRNFLDALKKNNLCAALVQHAVIFSENEINMLNKFLPGEPEWLQRQIIKFAISGLMSAMIEWHDCGCQESCELMARAMCRMFSKPLFPALPSIQ